MSLYSPEGQLLGWDHQPLELTLQHNPVAQEELRRRFGVAQRTHDDAMDYAFALSAIEGQIATLRSAIVSAERRRQDWQAAAAAVPVPVEPHDDFGAENLRQQLAAAERNLAATQQAHAAASERYRLAHNEHADFKRKVYAQ